MPTEPSQKPDLSVALISEVFIFPHDVAPLEQCLIQARSKGAELAVLPELPLNTWVPAIKNANEIDAEPPGGPRHQALSSAARNAKIGVVGGAIVLDPGTGRRYNTALVFDDRGTLVASYRKLHLPDEDGFWETHHYHPGDTLGSVIDGFGLRFAVQICSDVNRPTGCLLLASLGAEIIINPRATEAATFQRWKTVFIATALTSATYLLSVARPRPEVGVPLGGPSFAVAPTGEVLLETTEQIAVVPLYRSVIQEAKQRYPGYLATRADLYVEGWKRATTTKFPRETTAR